MTLERHQKQMCLFRRGDYRYKDHNDKNSFRVQVPVKIISVAQKPSTIKEQHQEKLYVYDKLLDKKY
jgi:hypothetical protein